LVPDVLRPAVFRAAALRRAAGRRVGDVAGAVSPGCSVSEAPTSRGSSAEAGVLSALQGPTVSSCDTSSFSGSSNIIDLADRWQSLRALSPVIERFKPGKRLVVRKREDYRRRMARSVGKRRALTIVVIGASLLAVVGAAPSTHAAASPRAATQALPPFNLGPSPVRARGTFTNGRGGCPVATSFADTFLLLAPGNGTLTITQPTTGDRVSGTIGPDGSFSLQSAGETYTGRIVGRTATATYAYTARGCTETYEVTFVLERLDSDLALALSAPGTAKMKRTGGRTFARVIYRARIFNNGPAASPGGMATFSVSRALFVYGYARGAVSRPQPAETGCSPRPRRSTTVFQCVISPLESGASETIVVFTEARRTGSYLARGLVTGVNVDPVEANNRATRRTNVRRG
jgi:hypothetical protein